MELPGNVKGSVINPVNIPFRDVAQLFYIISDTLNLNNNIRLIPNTCIDLIPRVVHIDLSENKSPYEFSSNPSWKGIYFAKYDIKYPQAFDYTHQLSFDQNVIQSFTSTDKTHAWIAPGGLFLLSDYTFSPADKGKFNTFPGNPGHYYLKVESSNIFSSFFKGSVKIPLISETTDFPFTIPISYDGFQTGYLDETLDGKSFVFNEAGGEEQKLNFTINRAVFSNKERLDLNVTIDWPFLNISFKNLDGLKVYGNSEIGFNKPGGAASLTQQIRTNLKGYPITIDYIGCGRQANLYAFGTSAKIVMGDDVAGENGPPVANLYSIAENKLLTGQYVASAKSDSTVLPAGNNSSSLGGSDVGIATPGKVTDNESQVLEAINKVTVSSQDVSSVFTQPTATNTNNLSATVNSPTEKPSNLTLAQEEKLKKVVYLVSKRLSEPLASKAGEVTGKIADELKSLTDTTIGKIQTYAHLVIDPIQKELTASLGGTEVGSAVAEICSYTLSESLKSVTNALQIYLDTAIITPLRNSGSTLVYNATGSTLYSMSVDVLQDGKDFDFRNSLNKAIEAAASNFDINKIKAQLNDKAKTFATTFLDANNLLAIIKTGISKKLQEIAEAKAKELVSGYVNNQLSSGGSKQIADNVMNNVKFDFSNLGDKLKNGRIDQIIKLDPSYIKVQTSVADFEGMVKFYDNDPTWGNSWQANISATIKVAPNFTAGVRYINGTKSNGNSGDYKFWLLKLSAQGLNIPMSPLPVSFDGAEGLVYHHMKKMSADQYLPDPDTKYGVGLRAFFFDTPGKGATVVFNVGLELAFMERGFIMQLDGQADVGNTIEGGKVVKSIITAKGLMQYNSEEKHFLANLSATLNTSPWLCAGGEFNLDIYENKWQVSLGTRDNPIMMRLLCKDFLTAKSWLMINQNGIDLGLVNKCNIDLSTPWIGPSACQIKGYVKIDFEFGATTVIIWKPQFGVQEAKVWLDLLVALGIEYKTFFNSGNMVIASVGLGGSLAFGTMPQTYLRGKMYGNVTVMNCGIGFDMDVDKTF
jgi:hypothetical protein